MLLASSVDEPAEIVDEVELRLVVEGNMEKAGEFVVLVATEEVDGRFFVVMVLTCNVLTEEAPDVTTVFSVDKVSIALREITTVVAPVELLTDKAISAIKISALDKQ